MQIEVVEALLFRRADRFAAAVLRDAGDEVWRAISNKGYWVSRVSAPDVAERLQRERAASIQGEADPLRKLNMLLEDGAGRVDVASEVSSVLQEPGFPARDEYGSVRRAYELYPDEGDQRPRPKDRGRTGGAVLGSRRAAYGKFQNR